MTAKESLELNFRESLGLPEEAILFLLNTWDAIQFFDDIADGDKTSRASLNSIIFGFFIGYAKDPFYQKHRPHLESQLETMILKWEASDIAERQGESSAKSYMWRAGFYDLVLSVIPLCYPHEDCLLLSKVVMDLYGEDFGEYMKEFQNA